VAVHGAGQAAVTRVRPIAVGEACSLLELELLTGRTHQIRVHLAHEGHPVLGDDKYGDFALNRTLAKQGVTRLMLHARRLRLSHPLSGARLELEAALPPDMRRYAEAHLALPPGRL
jgi:23S rRNA pseudouridine955/2504/2580 synthase